MKEIPEKKFEKVIDLARVYLYPHFIGLHVDHNKVDFSNVLILVSL